MPEKGKKFKTIRDLENEGLLSLLDRRIRAQRKGGTNPVRVQYYKVDF